MMAENKSAKSGAAVSGRDAFKDMVGAAAVAVGAASSAHAATQSDLPTRPDPAAEAKNPYGSPPGSGNSMPPYYRPTPSVKNRNNYFPQTEELDDDEMRIIFMGSNPWPPRLKQAGTCIMVECGKVGRFFFDFGSGSLRNIVGMQVPIPE